MNQRKAIVLAGLVILFWSTVASAFKMALAEMTPVLLVTIASLITLIIASIALVATDGFGEMFRLFGDKKALAEGALFGVINPFFYYIILFKAYSLLPAQITQPLNFSWQVILVIMLSIVYRQRLKTKEIIGVLISYAGVIVLSTNNSVVEGGTLSIAGIVLTITSTFLWAGYWVLRLKSKLDSIPGLFMNFFFGSLYLVVLILIYPESIEFEGRSIFSGDYPSWRAMFTALYVGVFEMGITFILWGKALKLAVNKVQLTQLTYLCPVLSLFFILIILKEQINIFTIFGLFMIIAGLIVGQNNRFLKKRAVKE